MNIAIYIIAGLFILMAVAMFFTARRMGHSGLLVMAVTYGVAAGLALALMQWWPLAAGLALAWLLKLIGLEPRVDADKNAEKRDE